MARKIHAIKMSDGLYAPDIGKIQKMNGLRVGYVPQHLR